MVQQIDVDGEQVILSESGALVASRSEPGGWHVVKDVNGVHQCDCKSFQYRGQCRHVHAVEQIERARAASPAGVERGDSSDTTSLARFLADVATRVWDATREPATSTKICEAEAALRLTGSVGAFLRYELACFDEEQERAAQAVLVGYTLAKLGGVEPSDDPAHCAGMAMAAIGLRPLTAAARRQLDERAIRAYRRLEQPPAGAGAASPPDPQDQNVQRRGEPPGQL